MAIQLSAPKATELKPRIVVFGVGGAGGNAVNNMIDAGLEGVEFVVANTDAQALSLAKTPLRIQLGVQTTQGLGAGAHPDVGMSAAEESIPEIGEHLDGAHMVFITAGMGGGTGTGAAPIIAKLARERGILTVGVITKPFTFEGRHRTRLSEAGIAELQRYVDTLIIIPNQNLFRIANERTTFTEAFGMADQVLHSGVRSITDLMVLPGLINLDFADVRTVMTEMGKAMMGTGEASGEDRALMAAQNAIQNPLLDEVSLRGAKAVLVNVTGGLDMTLLEVDEAANAISEQVDAEANIIFGAAFDPSLEGMIRVSVVATGMDGASIAAIEPKPRRAPAETPILRVPEHAPIAETQPLWEPQPTAAMTPITPVRAAQEQIAQEFNAESWDDEAEEVAVAREPEEIDLPFETAMATIDVEETRGFGASEDVEEIISTDEAVEAAEEAPMSFEPRHEERKGFFSLFGRSRQDDVPPLRDYRNDPTPAIQARIALGGTAPAPAPQMEQQEEGEDLEIPSFLRRLAN
ncbi:MAG: cell division protein FtsZ [Alphaproteobacteria bacterium]